MVPAGRHHALVHARLDGDRGGGGHGLPCAGSARRYVMPSPRLARGHLSGTRSLRTSALTPRPVRGHRPQCQLPGTRAVSGRSPGIEVRDILVNSSEAVSTGFCRFNGVAGLRRCPRERVGERRVWSAAWAGRPGGGRRCGALGAGMRIRTMRAFACIVVPSWLFRVAAAEPCSRRVPGSVLNVGARLRRRFRRVTPRGISVIRFWPCGAPWRVSASR
jgi:hypothetical protein